MTSKCEFHVRSAVAGVAVAAATAGAVLAGCGGSSGTKTTARSSSAPQAAASDVGGTKGFTGRSICGAVAARQAEQALGGPVGSAKPAEPKKGVHACSWAAADGRRALVAVVFDDSFDKKFVDDAVTFTNGVAGTGFPTATNTTIDVGARNVTVYGLSAPDDRVAYAGLSTVANTVNDFIVGADTAARGSN